MASITNSSSSICGIGIGSENCYVAVARQGGIEILLNEYSQRSTPAYVAFGGNQREIGVAAKQKQMMNLRNTCFAPTLIIGKTFQELNIKEIPYKVEQGPNNEVLIRVSHNGEEQVLTSRQVLAMLFTKLRQISGNPVDCVINCPNYFDFIQRRALYEAAVIAGLNPLRIISDMTAIALYYGFYRSSPTEISVVGFFDCGQTSSQTAIVLFNHKENSLKVLDSGFLPDVGGKHFDEILANYFIEKHNLKLNERSRYRLIAECEKLKKNLSANPNELPINIECLYEEKDFSSKIDRATFEQIAQELLNKISSMLKTTYQRAKEKFEKEYQEKYGDFRVDSVEIVGGTSRIPAIKRMVKEICGFEPSTTLNADEAVARGCALQCAILSPIFKVARELHINDILPFNVDFKYEIPGKDVKTIPAMYPRGHPFPFAKQITISSQTLPISISFYYENLKNEKICLSHYKISELPGSNASQIMMEYKNSIKIRVRIDPNCFLGVISATISYETLQPVEEEPMEQQPSNPENDQNKMETDQQQQQQQQPPTPSQESQQPNDQQQPQAPQMKLKKKIQTIDLLIEPLFIAGELPKTTLDKFIEMESNFILADKNWKEKTDARNALEEFVYEWRDRIESGDYEAFINPVNKNDFQVQLEANAKWLYEQDEQEVMHSKTVYEERTNSMATKFAKGIILRKKEFENRPRFLEQLGHQLQQARKLIETSEPDEKEEIKRFKDEIEEKQKWFDDVSGKLVSMQTYDDPPYTCEDINNQTMQLHTSIVRVQNNRKRRAEEKAEKEKQAGDGQKTQEQQEGPTKMDVDPEPVQQPQAEAQVNN